MNAPISSPTPKPLWQKALVIGLILLGLLVSLIFTLRSFRSFRQAQMLATQHAGPATVEMIRGWMTIPYIAQTYQVPEDVLYQSLGISAEQAESDNLSALNRQLFRGQPGEGTRRVQQAIRDYWAEHPTPSLQVTRMGTPAP